MASSSGAAVFATMSLWVYLSVYSYMWSVPCMCALFVTAHQHKRLTASGRQHACTLIYTYSHHLCLVCRLTSIHLTFIVTFLASYFKLKSPLSGCMALCKLQSTHVCHASCIQNDLDHMVDWQFPQVQYQWTELKDQQWVGTGCFKEELRWHFQRLTTDDNKKFKFLAFPPLLL